MTYHGHVDPGGPAAVRELPKLMISKMSVGPMDNNTYLLRDRTTGTQLLIDASNDAPKILELVGSDGVETIVTTHGHPDHWQALGEVAIATSATTAAGELDLPMIDFPIERTLTHGEVINFGECTLTAIHLRGHTPGSIALVYDDPMGHGHLFSGDCLFPGGVGKTWSDEDFDLLFADVSERLFSVYSDETWVYPGHGDDTTLGQERPNLTVWQSRRW